jgi:hypothetical protein
MKDDRHIQVSISLHLLLQLTLNRRKHLLVEKERKIKNLSEAGK